MILDEKQKKKARLMESTKRIINLSLVMGCLALEIGSFGFHWFYHFQHSVVEPLRDFYFKGHVLEIMVYGIVLFLISNMYGGMRLGYMKNSEIVFSQLFSTVLADIFIWGELSILAGQPFRLPYFVMMGTEQFIAVLIYIPIANKIYRHIFPPRKLLLIYGNTNKDTLSEKFETRKDKYVITDKIKAEEGYDAIVRRINDDYSTGKINAVIIGDMTVAQRKPLIKYCYGNSIRFYLLPKIGDVILSGAEELHVFDSPILLTREYSLTVEQRVIKRTIDIVFSLLLIILTSPFMLLTAIAVKLCDKGPILYRQIRCTRDAREFTISKFRSMRVDAESDGVARLASKGDSRITPVGKFIRKCRLDELPQLFNILKGDMSFIGPRPERPEIIQQYVDVMPEFAFRMKVKAGLAGFAQVYGKYNTTPYDKLKLDLIYIEQYSLMLDLKLMLLTLKVLMWPDSTEGVEKEQITALKNGQDDSYKQED